MKSKSILQMKPELIGVALIMAFMLSGTAAADINPSMISVGAIGDLLHSEAVALFWIIEFIMIVFGAILIAIGSSESKAWGYRVEKGVILAGILFFVIPWIISEVQNVSTTGGNTTAP